MSESATEAEVSRCGMRVAQHSVSQQHCPLLSIKPVKAWTALTFPLASPLGSPPSFQVAQLQPSSCHISYWIGCLIKIIIKIDLLISMHLLCLSHPRVLLSTEDVKTDRQEPDPRPAQPSGAGR